EASNNATRDIVNPYNQEVILTVSEGTAEDAAKAIQAAKNAFESGVWADETSESRCQKVREIADLIKKNKDELAELETLDTGKTLEESYADMDYIHNLFMYFAGLGASDGVDISE